MRNFLPAMCWKHGLFMFPLWNGTNAVEYPVAHNRTEKWLTGSFLPGDRFEGHDALILPPWNGIHKLITINSLGDVPDRSVTLLNSCQ